MATRPMQRTGAMSFITKSLLFASVATISILAGIVTHTVQFRYRVRTPVKLLRAFFSTGLICAAVAMLLFYDYLQAPDPF
jgi:hypothetical protein